MLARRIFLPSFPIIFNTIYNSTEEILYIYIYFFIFEYKLFPFPKFSSKFARSSRYTIRDVNINTKFDASSTRGPRLLPRHAWDPKIEEGKRKKKGGGRAIPLINTFRDNGVEEVGKEREVGSARGNRIPERARSGCVANR